MSGNTNNKDRAKHINQDLKIKNPLNLFGYKVVFEKIFSRGLVKPRVIVNIFKGHSIAGEELAKGTDNKEKKLRMVRLKVRFENNLIEQLSSIDNIQARETIEQLDIDYSILEKFFLKEFDKYIARKILNDLRDRLDDDKVFPVGSNVMTIKLEYEEWIKLVNFLSLIANDFENKKVNL